MESNNFTYQKRVATSKMLDAVMFVSIGLWKNIVGGNFIFCLTRKDSSCHDVLGVLSRNLNHRLLKRHLSQTVLYFLRSFFSNISNDRVSVSDDRLQR